MYEWVKCVIDPKCGELSEYTDSTRFSHQGGVSFFEIYEWVKMWVTDADTTQYNFILPARHPNEANCQNTLTVLTLRWMISLLGVWMGEMCVTDVVTTQFHPSCSTSEYTAWHSCPLLT